MSEPTAELVIALLGDPASFERMMTGAEARLNKFLQAVDTKGQQIQTSVDWMLGSVATSAAKLDGALQPVVSAFGDVATSASVAGAEAKAAGGELRAVSGDASAAAKSLTSVGIAGKSAGQGVAAGMGQMVGGVSKAQSALSSFAGMVNRVRAAASKPIVQRVIVQQTGGAPSLGGGFRGRVGSEAAVSALTQAGSTLTGMGVGLAAPLLAASVAVNDFDKAILDAANNTTMTAAEVNTLRTNVIALARETNAPLDKIAAAFMRAANFGYSGAKGMEVVRAANLAATASGADLEKVTEAVAQTMNQFHIPVEDASRVMNLLSYASDSTNQKLDSFVATAGRGFQAAATLHVGLADAAAVMGVLTEKGLSAAQSQTAFRAIVKGIIQPTKQAQGEIKHLSDTTGIDLVSAFSAAGLAHYGLVRVMDMATKATHGNADALKKVFTDSRNFVPMLTLMAEKHAELTRVMSGSEKAFLDNSRTQEQYQARVKTAAYQLDNLKNRAIIAGAAFEEQLAPAMKDVVGLLDKLLDFIQRLSAPQKQMLADTLAIGSAVALLTGGLASLIGKVQIITEGVVTLAAKFGLASVAAEGVGTASTAAAAEGVTAFGAAMPWALAIVAAIALIGGIAVAWKHAADAQDAYAKKKLDAQAALNTPDVRTNTSNAIAQTQQEAVRQQAIVAALKADPTATVRHRDPSSGIMDDSVVPWGKGSHGTRAQAKAQNARDLSQFEANVAALKASTKSLQDDNAATSNLGMTKRNYQRQVENATKSQAQITARLAELDKAIAGYAGVHINNTKEQVAFGKLTAERSVQQRNYDALERDKRKNQKSADYVGKLESKELTASGGVGRGMETGGAIANVAWKKQLSLDRAAYNDGCQRLARETVQTVTPAFNKYFAGTALETLRNFQKAGLALPYTPGMSIPAGSLLYSETMGKRKGKIDGHVAVEGVGGHYVDQHGQDTYALKNFQYYVPPPSGVVGSKASALPSYVTGGGGPKGTLADFGGDGKPKKGAAPSAGSLKNIDLSRVPSVAALPADLANAATNAQTFEVKLQGLTEAFAEHNLKLKQTAPGYDELAAKTAYYGQRLTLTNNAIRNTQTVLDTLTPKTEREAAAVKTAVGAYNSYTDKMKGIRAAGGKLSPGDVQEVQKLRAAYQSAMDTFKADDAALKENQRVHSSAVASKISDLEELGRVRDEQARKQEEAGRKDAEASHQQAEAMRQFEEGVRVAVERADELEKINIELGKESETAFRDRLVAALADAQAQFGETSLEAAKLSLEIAHIDWQATTDQVDELRSKFDEGDISIEKYVAGLKELQKLTNSTSGHKAIGHDIDQANKTVKHQQQEEAKEAERKAEENIQKITDKATGMVMQIIHHAKTIPEAFRDAFQEVLNGVIENFVKQMILKIVTAVVTSNKSLATLGQGAGSSAGDGKPASGLLGLASSFVGGAGPGPSTSGIGSVLSGGGSLGGVLGGLEKALPMVGALVGGAALLSGLFGSTKHTPTSTQTQQYAGILNSFSPTINSGFSGSDGLRDLLGNTTRAATGVSSVGQANQGHTFNINIAANAFNGLANPQQHGMAVVQTIQTEIAKSAALDNASRGNG